MSGVAPARLEFAVTASVHFAFVLLTLGLVTLVAVLQTRYARTGDPLLGRATRFWGLLYAVNYAVGIATGIVMEFQFGLNWRGLDGTTGDVFGAPLALETLIAFVAESTLLGMWIFGWGRLGRRVHAALIWGVALTAYLSAFWVMAANAFLQHPVGYAVDRSGRVRLTSFAALLGNPTLWLALAHVLAAAVLAGGLFVAGVSAWHLRRGDDPLFGLSLRVGLIPAVGAALVTMIFGGTQFAVLDATQPAKLAGPAAMARIQASMVARYGPGDYAPPGWIGAALDTMIYLWVLLFLVLLAGVVVLQFGGPAATGWRGWVLRALTWAIPLPPVAALSGWLFREVGRQPWIVYGLLRTSDAAGPLSRSTVVGSLVVVGLVVGGLAVLDWWLLARIARRGPGTEFLPEPVPEPDRGSVFAGAEA